MFAKIAAVINEPRPFIRNKTYFGPDRRRLATGFKLQGAERRKGFKVTAPDDDDRMDVPRGKFNICGLTVDSAFAAVDIGARRTLVETMAKNASHTRKPGRSERC